MTKRLQYRCLFSLLPAFVLVGGVLLYPALSTIVHSFFEWDGFTREGFVGFENYRALFGDRGFINFRNLSRFPETGPPFGALIHSIIWTILFVPSTMVIGLAFAALTRTLPGKQIAKVLFLLPLSVPMVVVGIVVYFLVDARAGLFNALLRTVGYDHLVQTWTNNPNLVLLILIAGSIWIFSGLTMLIYSAGLETIPDSVAEAAEIDGATRGQIFRHITLPLLRTSHRTAGILMTIWSLKVFDLVYSATLGGPGQSSSVLGILLYSKSFYQLRIGQGLAIAAILTLLGVTLSVLMLLRSHKD